MSGKSAYADKSQADERIPPEQASDFATCLAETNPEITKRLVGAVTGWYSEVPDSNR